MGMHSCTLQYAGSVQQSCMRRNLYLGRPLHGRCWQRSSGWLHAGTAPRVKTLPPFYPVLQLPTRRFVHALLDDRAVLVKCTLSPLCSGQGPQGVLFAQLVDLLRFYSGFPIADHTGEALGEEEVVATHYERVRGEKGGGLGGLQWVHLGGSGADGQGRRLQCAQLGLRAARRLCFGSLVCPCWDIRVAERPARCTGGRHACTMRPRLPAWHSRAHPTTPYPHPPLGHPFTLQIQALQRLFFRHVPELRDLALASCAQVQRRDVLSKALRGLEPATLRRLVCRQLRCGGHVQTLSRPARALQAWQLPMRRATPRMTLLRGCDGPALRSTPPSVISTPRLIGEDDPWAEDLNFLVEVAVTAYERRRLQAETVNAMPLYPTERVLFDEHQVPTLHYTGECRAGG